MDVGLKMLGTGLGIWVGYHVILFVMTWVQLLRIPLAPVRVVLDFDGPPEPGLLPPDQQAWLDELCDLGFELSWTGQLARDKPPSFDIAYLRHRSEPVVATVTFCPSALVIYPVELVSEDTQGRLLITQNRLGFMGELASADVLIKDVYVPSLGEHLAAHRQWLVDEAAVQADRPLNPRRIAERMAARAEAWLEGRRQEGRVVRHGDEWHHGAKSAATMAWAMMRVRRELMRPFQSRLMQGDHLVSFLTQCYLFTEQQLSSRPARHNLKALVLVLSMGLSLAFWGWAFDWAQAIALVAILFVHELGHALAMRAFGWKDMNMFFVPFMGAMVTGRPAATIPAWKQAVVLLAGPMPGLLAGGAFLWLGHPMSDGGVDWQRIATMAVAINLFNLLPLGPLDGGQLVDWIVFSRWPRMRWAFALLSTLAFLGLAVFLQEPVLWGLVVWLCLTLPMRWRTSQIDLSHAAGLDRKGQLTALFVQVRDLFPKTNLFKLHAIAKGIDQRQAMTAPRGWESVGVLGVLLAVWVGSAVALVTLMDRRVEWRDERSTAQSDFDNAWYSDFDGASHADALKAVRAAASQLAPGDPRWFDLDVREAQALPAPQRRARVAALMKSGRDGDHEHPSGLVSSELDQVWELVRRQPPGTRLADMQEAMAWAERVSPQDLQSMIDLKLRILEAQDELGQTDQVRDDLQRLRERAEHDESCRCAMRPIIRAQAWFYLSHAGAPLALRVLDTSPYATSIRAQHDGLSLDHGWVQLLAGQTQPGIEMIKAASYAKPDPEPKWFDRLRGKRAQPPQVEAPLELAFALDKMGQAEQMRETLRASWARAQCRRALEGFMYEDRYPWQKLRDQHLQSFARAHCLPEQASSGS